MERHPTYDRALHAKYVTRPVVTVNGSRFVGCRRSRVPRAERRLPGRESVADRPQPVIGMAKIGANKQTFGRTSRTDFQLTE